MRFGISQNDWKTEKNVFGNLKMILFLKRTKDENEYFTRFHKKIENDKSFKFFSVLHVIKIEHHLQRQILLQCIPIP